MNPQEGHHGPGAASVSPGGRPPGLFEAVWRHRVGIVLVVLFASTCAFWLSSRQPRVYKADAALLFSSSSLGGERQGLLPDQDAGSFLAGEAIRVTSAPVTAAASRSLGGRPPPDEISGKVKAAPAKTGPMITITASGGTAMEVARLADAVAASYVQVLSEQIRTSPRPALQRLQSQYQAVQKQLDDLRQKGGQASAVALLQGQLGVLVDQLSRLAAASASFDPGVQVIRHAVPPGSPVSPSPQRDALLAALVAALAAGAAAWGMEVRAHQRSDLGRISRLLRVPECGCVTAPADGAEHGPVPLQGKDLVGRSTLATSADWQLVALALDKALGTVGGRSVLVTSVPGLDERGQAAANLAVAAAGDGRYVLLVDADHDSRASSLIGAGQGHGPERNGRADDDGQSSGREPGVVSLFTVSRPIHDSAAFYRRQDFRETMHAFHKSADLVIVHAPPVLESPDAYVLADVVDAVLLIVHDSAKDEHLRQVRDKLDHAKAPLVGYVVLQQRHRVRRGRLRVRAPEPAMGAAGGDAVSTASLPVRHEFSPGPTRARAGSNGRSGGGVKRS